MRAESLSPSFISALACFASRVSRAAEKWGVTPSAENCAVRFHVMPDGKDVFGATLTFLARRQIVLVGTVMHDNAQGVVLITADFSATASFAEIDGFPSDESVTRWLEQQQRLARLAADPAFQQFVGRWIHH